MSERRESALRAKDLIKEASSDAEATELALLAEVDALIYIGDQLNRVAAVIAMDRDQRQEWLES